MQSDSPFSSNDKLIGKCEKNVTFHLQFLIWLDTIKWLHCSTFGCLTFLILAYNPLILTITDNLHSQTYLYVCRWMNAFLLSLQQDFQWLC